MSTAHLVRRVEVQRVWPGATVVCVASGPSLVAEDVEHCRGKAKIIAVNGSVRLAPFADVLYSSDEGWWARWAKDPELAAARMEFRGLKYGIADRRGRKSVARRWPDVCVLDNAGASGLSLDPWALTDGRNSGAAAINLAMLLGAAHILLLGYDMKIHSGKAHFYPEKGQVPASPHAMFARMIDTMAEPLRRAGVEVINCTRETALTCFPKAALRDVLQ